MHWEEEAGVARFLVEGLEELLASKPTTIAEDEVFLRRLQFLETSSSSNGKPLTIHLSLNELLSAQPSGSSGRTDVFKAGQVSRVEVLRSDCIDGSEASREDGLLPEHQDKTSEAQAASASLWQTLQHHRLAVRYRLRRKQMMRQMAHGLGLQADFLQLGGNQR